MKFGSRKNLSLLAIAIFLATTTSCQAPQVRPTSFSPAESAAIVTEFDRTVLQGRKIVIDPGHGGPWSGAVARSGLREADVNLDVALHLRSLLAKAGAESHLTREEDTAIVSDGETDLNSDLSSRINLANRLDADIFLSIHHNSSLDRRRNSLEIYFKSEDDGPSLDVARAIIRSLAKFFPRRTLGQVRAMGGNYQVLREAKVPAILVESSYLSHPGNARQLGQLQIRRREATALYHGLRDYFAYGTPKVEVLSPLGTVTGTAKPPIEARIDEKLGVAIAPDSVRLALDDGFVPVRFDPETRHLKAVPPRPLVNGEHRIRIEARTIQGNAVRVNEHRFRIDLPPAQIELFELAIEETGAPDVIDAVARVYDRFQNPVADGVEVFFRASGGRIVMMEPLTRDGMARCRVRPSGRVVRLSVTAGGASSSLSIPVRTSVLSGLRGQVLTAPGIPLRDVTVIRTHKANKLEAEPETSARSDSDGRFFLEGVEKGDRVRLSAPGYYTQRVKANSDPLIVQLEPIAAGRLLGRRIAVDPAGGGRSAGATGPGGLRASDVNLQVARAVTAVLQKTGAKVLLIRDRDISLSDEARVSMAESFGAEVYLRIEHSATARSAILGHYHNSTRGIWLANAFRNFLSAHIRRSSSTLPSTHYTLVQTSCPAIVVTLPGLNSFEGEERVSSRSYVLNLSQAVYGVLSSYFGLSGIESAMVEGSISGRDGTGLAGAEVVMGECFRAISDRKGRFFFSRLDEGMRRVEVFYGGLKIHDSLHNIQAGGVTDLQLDIPAEHFEGEESS